MFCGVQSQIVYKISNKSPIWYVMIRVVQAGKWKFEKAEVTSQLLHQILCQYSKLTRSALIPICNSV